MSGDSATGGGSTGQTSSNNMMPGMSDTITQQLVAGYGGDPAQIKAWLDSIYQQPTTAGGGGSPAGGGGTVGGTTYQPSGSGFAEKIMDAFNHAGIGQGGIPNSFRDMMNQAQSNMPTNLPGMGQMPGGFDPSNFWKNMG